MNAPPPFEASLLADSEDEPERRFKRRTRAAFILIALLFVGLFGLSIRLA